MMQRFQERNPGEHGGELLRVVGVERTSASVETRTYSETQIQAADREA
ncbi:hypothetical protein [Bradyrhizobium genosp. P]